MEYRKRMFRGAKIEDCIKDFIQMEQVTREQVEKDTGELQTISKGMNQAYRNVVNRMVRDFEYKKEELAMREKIEEAAKLFQQLAQNNRELSQKSLYESIQETYYKSDIPEEAIEELKNTPREFHEGMFEGLSFAYEQAAAYLAIVLQGEQTVNEKSINFVIDQINDNHLMKQDKFGEEAKTYQQGFVQGVKSGFGISRIELEKKFNRTA
ncbi:hypothetical protein JOC54_000459 [Alkalihalobacillus xiaoxiensis]|uniref:Uncharacterized protein n=1 Tax=Shouchella xiaoxiensis TaxID=766895 RepID=A0ABS2SNX7_9BACI|nr:hypothetical protein [Shouchella xiaoxiensis]MBM7837228.1 hypothetical protein [Shouchella xiaoxiensis]